LAVSIAVALSGSGVVRSDQSEPTVRVAAVQYAGSSPTDIDPDCGAGDVNCAVEALIRRAKSRGASLVVTPEYGLTQSTIEASPSVGSLPADVESAPIATRFGELAAELGIYLVINMETRDGGRLRNTQVAFDPDGRVVARHHKFELYESERDSHVAGDDVTAFETPFGRVGLLICADIYGDPRLHDRLTDELGAHIVAFSTQWTVAGATRWPAAFARDWGVYVVAANGSGGKGKGSGVFDPTGKALAIDASAAPLVTIADVPIGD
jgi:predicted amidohydrolase